MTCAVVGFDENAKYLKIFEYLVGTLGALVKALGKNIVGYKESLLRMHHIWINWAKFPFV